MKHQFTQTVYEIKCQRGLDNSNKNITENPGKSSEVLSCI